jgi:enolase
VSAVVKNVVAWEALDSRGRPTVATRVVLTSGHEGIALVPSGASAGSHEAVTLRDGGTRYQGRGVRGAVANITSLLGPRLVGLEPAEVDAALAAADESPSFATVGANAVLALSIAAARADAATSGASLARHLAGGSRPLLLPMPMVNILSGGAHAGGMLDVQDFLVVPVGAKTFAEAIEWAGAVRESATRLALGRGYGQAVLVADEGGLGLPLETNRAALALLTEAIESAGFTAGAQVAVALDFAATQFFDGAHYCLACEKRELTAHELVNEIAEWCDRYPVVSVEDILAEDDWGGWSDATKVLGERVELVGDDLFVTSVDRLRRGIDLGVANSVLIKLDQNGLLSGAASVVDLARRSSYRTVVSGRSGDTEDSWLADVAVGWRAGQIKIGSTHRSERNAKWNRLLQLEATEHTTFAGPWSGGRPERNRA